MSSRQVPLSGLLLVVMLPFASDARAQAPDRVCSSPEIRAGLVLRVRSYTPLDTTRGSVIGPLVRCTDGFLVLGLYPGQDDPEYRVATASIRRVWVRNHAGPLGLLVGTAAGAASGVGIAAVRSDLCYRGAPPVASPCHHDVVSYALVGGVVGGVLGYVLGRGFPHWNKIFP
jgi:hypothetical protein